MNTIKSISPNEIEITLDNGYSMVIRTALLNDETIKAFEAASNEQAIRGADLAMRDLERYSAHLGTKRENVCLSEYNSNITGILTWDGKHA